MQRSIPMKRTTFPLVIIGISHLLFVNPATILAADSYWKGFPVGSFSEPTNWFGGVPGLSQTARFTNSSNQKINWVADVQNANAIFSFSSGVVTQSIGAFRWTVTNQYMLGAENGSS